MSALFWFTYGLSWFLTLSLFVMVVLMYRQFGLMMMPGSKRTDLAGLDVGSKAPFVSLDLDDGRGARWFEWAEDDLAPPRTAWLLLFAQPGCSICKDMWENQPLGAVAGGWPHVEFLWVESRPRTTGAPEHWTVARPEGDHASEAMDIPAYPFAYVIDRDGKVASKGLVNGVQGISRVIDDAGLSLPVGPLHEIQLLDPEPQTTGGQR